MDFPPSVWDMAAAPWWFYQGFNEKDWNNISTLDAAELYQQKKGMAGFRPLSQLNRWYKYSL